MWNRLKRYVGHRATRRLYRALPLVGGIVALATLGSAIRRKGWFAGTADTALDFIPFVGGAKALAEVARGGDFIPDKRVTR